MSPDDWTYDTAPDLDQGLLERLKRFPREPDILVYGLRSLSALAMRAWLRLYNRLCITGKEHLPTDRPFILVSNHQSHLDTLCLLSALPFRRLHQAFPAAAQDYFFQSIRRLTVAAIVVNAMPFSRSFRGQQSLAMCQALLQNPSNVLILFPEGTRSQTGELGTFKPGIGIIAAGTEVPVVPCRLEGAQRALPKGAWLPRPCKLRLTIGEPMQFPDRDGSKASVRAIASELRAAVAALAPDYRS